MKMMNREIIREYENTIIELTKRIENKDLEISFLKQMHDYDTQMIDDVKGETVKLYKEIREKDRIIKDIINRLDKENKNNDKMLYYRRDKNSKDFIINAIVKPKILNIRSNPILCYDNFPIGTLLAGTEVEIEGFESVKTEEKMELWGKIAQKDKKTKYKEEWICLKYCLLEIKGE